MKTKTSHGPSDAERQERLARIAAFSLLLDYLKNAQAALGASSLEESDPQIVAALIVAQSIDHHGEVVACELRRGSEALRIDLESLEDRLVITPGR